MHEHGNGWHDADHCERRSTLTASGCIFVRAENRTPGQLGTFSSASARRRPRRRRRRRSSPFPEGEALAAAGRTFWGWTDTSCYLCALAMALLLSAARPPRPAATLSRKRRETTYCLPSSIQHLPAHARPRPHQHRPRRARVSHLNCSVQQQV